MKLMPEKLIASGPIDVPICINNAKEDLTTYKPAHTRGGRSAVLACYSSFVIWFLAKAELFFAE